jgi:phenylpyruvate tautomerase PptA (4-oxalocrotonate tautomerase family)
MFEGRDKDTKAKIMKLVTEAICEGCSVGPDAVTIIIQDVPRSDWGKAGKPYG